MARKISKKRLEALASRVNTEAKAEGSSGWSVRAYGKDRGTEARDSFMVALPKSEVEQPVFSPVTASAMSQYQRKFKSLLKRPGMYHGGWIPQGGMGAQDVSAAYPRTEEGLTAAMTAGAYGEQQAIGDVGPSGYEGDIPVPTHLSSQFWPERTQVTEKGGVVDIVPSRREMAEVEAKEVWRQRNQ